MREQFTVEEIDVAISAAEKWKNPNFAYAKDCDGNDCVGHAIGRHRYEKIKETCSVWYKLYDCQRDCVYDLATDLCGRDGQNRFFSLTPTQMIKKLKALKRTIK